MDNKLLSTRTNTLKWMTPYEPVWELLSHIYTGKKLLGYKVYIMHNLIKYHPSKWLDQSILPPVRNYHYWAATMHQALGRYLRPFCPSTPSFSSASLCPFCSSYQLSPCQKYEGRTSSLVSDNQVPFSTPRIP